MAKYLKSTLIIALLLLGTLFLGSCGLFHSCHHHGKHAECRHHR